ncbi:MAG: type II toxin-antitoxin system VapC family toxin [Mesorhizobium sp.]|nr:type II toxin-antitoxin system VapC family toxin [Mesorhizobium sp.]MCO5161653.1 type II toxin-antitoxin system VapC family toxin [Mesorhizobium sp.]
MIVVDASVLIKLFKDEVDSPAALALVDQVVEERSGLLAPTIAMYEALTAALHVDYPLASVHTLFAWLTTVGLELLPPSAEDIAIAERIARTRARGGGFPTLYDSIYHAMAIRLGCDFVTADIKHIAKAAGFGNILSLADWSRTRATPPRS